MTISLDSGMAWKMAGNCSSCDKKLEGHPKIGFDGDAYCYKCAKRVVGNQDRLAEQEQSAKLEGYRTQFEIWQHGLKGALPSTGTQIYIIGGIAVGFAFFVENRKDGDNVTLFHLFCGLAVGAVINHFYAHRKRERWILQNPKPANPSCSPGNVASNRIELIGQGTKGEEYSAAKYRRLIMERDGYQCQNCGAIFPADQLEVHHIIPQSSGGKHFSNNLITLCFDCHLDEHWFGHSHYMRKRFRVQKRAVS